MALLLGKPADQYRPDQELFDQYRPDQYRPDQELSTQVRWFQFVPVQVAAAHVFEAQEVPVQPSPVTRFPIHTPPFHAVRFFAAVTHALALNGPKTLESPVRAAAPSTTWMPPRAESSEPSPFDPPVGSESATATP